MATPNTYLTGDAVRICFGDVEIPCSLIESARVTISQEVNDIRSLCGLAYSKKRVPQVEVELNFIYRNMELIREFFPGLYAGTTAIGGVSIGSGTCATVNNVKPLNLHPICDTNGTATPDTAVNDWTIFAADPIFEGEFFYEENAAETFTVKFKSVVATPFLADGVTPNPHAGKVALFGQPAALVDQKWDCATQDFVAA